MARSRTAAGRTLILTIGVATWTAVPLAASAQPVVSGDMFAVEGRCVTITAVHGGQAHYAWRAGNTSGSGDLPVDWLTQRCGPASATEKRAPPMSATGPANEWPGAAANTVRQQLPLAPGRGHLGQDEVAALLEAHNALRAQVGVGPLAWRPDLAAYAQGYAAKLQAACSLRHSGGPHGENLAAWSGQRPAADAVALWAEERADYRGDGGAFSPEDMAAGHYTQVVWRSSTAVGCARVQCRQQGADWTLLSCNYSPRGNMLGAPVYR